MLKPAICTLILGLSIQSLATQADVYDIRDLQQPDTSTPAISGFYSVTPEGDTVPLDPVKSGFALDTGSDFDPERVPEETSDSGTQEEGSKKKSGDRKKEQESRTIQLRVRLKPPRRSYADKIQCERHGLYYTKDGRCIVPAYQHHLPQMPGQGMRPMLPD